MTVRTTSAGATVSEDHAYSVRPYEPADESAVRGLSAPTATDQPVATWLEWYGESPAVDRLPMALVEADGTIVGGVPFLALHIRADDQVAIAMAPGPTLIDPGRDPDALRERAIAGAMEYSAAATLADRPPHGIDIVTSANVDLGPALAVEDRPFVFFTFAAQPPDDSPSESDRVEERLSPIAAAADGIDWTHRAKSVRYDRIQHHGALLARRIPGPPGRALGAPFTGVGRRVRRVRDRRADFDTDPYTVAHHEGIPAATLGACYDANRPASTHTVADRAFYRWWAGRPDLGRIDTYVVHRGSRVAAALIAHREETRSDSLDVRCIDHVLPMTGGPTRPDAVAAGLQRLLREHTAADVVRTSNPLVPERVLAAYGFNRADRLPRSLLVSREDRVVGIHPTVAGDRRLGSRPIGEVVPFLWALAAGPWSGFN